jgi:hypothetical protein
MNKVQIIHYEIYIYIYIYHNFTTYLNIPFYLSKIYKEWHV